MGEQNQCAYEHCQRLIEIVPGHRRRAYCSDACRQAAHRLRQTEQTEVVASQKDKHLAAATESSGGAAPPQAQALMPLQAYLHTRPGASIELRRGRTTLNVTQIRNDGHAVAIGQGLISLADEEITQMHQQIAEAATGQGHDTGSGSADHQEYQVLRQRIAELEAERAEWIAWKEATVVFYARTTAMRQYLQEHDEVSIPIIRNGAKMKVLVLGGDAVAVTEDHGVIQLSDDELEQGRIWVARKTGKPVTMTRLPIGTGRRQS